MSGMNIKYTVINSGSAISDVIKLGNVDLFGIWCPVVTSCQLFLQASFDTTSANFVRSMNPEGVGNWAADIGPGSRAITGQDVGLPFQNMRLETSIAQTDTRTFAIISKL